ncbi:MAG: hypothetical protein ACREPM_11745 [Gemmatimonadaceae bacterium]
MLRFAGPTFATVSFVLAAACAATKTSSSAAPSAVHDMASMPGHDMASMGSHSAAETAFLFPDGDDKGWSKIENGTQHNMAAEVPLANLPVETRVKLLHQLSLTMDVIKKYPTVKDAEAAGYRRAGPFIPGLGTHYVGGRSGRGSALSDDDILHPSTIIYVGNAPTSPIAGFMYISSVMAGAPEPEGFAGPNDHWHYHTGICLVRGPNGAQEALGFDGSITQDGCKAKSGNWVATTQYLLHVWTVPGYSNPLGVFAHANPALTCGDGTYYIDEHDITNQCKHP